MDWERVPIWEDECIPRGQMVVMTKPPLWAVMHPLDRIAVECGKDFTARLEAAMTWLVRRAHARLDSLRRRL